MSFRIELGNRIKNLREKFSFTQQELAEIVGVESPSYLSKIERGSASPSYELLIRIAKAFKVELKDLFDTGLKIEKRSPDNLEKWIPKFRTILKGHKEKDIQSALYVLRKILSKKSK